MQATNFDPPIARFLSLGSCLWTVREVVASGWSSHFVEDSSGAIEGYRQPKSPCSPRHSHGAEFGQVRSAGVEE